MESRMRDVTPVSETGIWPNRNPPLRATKWLQLHVLLDSDEMQQLLNALAPVHICVTGRILQRGVGALPIAEFLTCYQQYIEKLKIGCLLDEAHYRTAFSSLWTRALDQLSVLAVGDHEQLIRPSYPVVQLRPHRFSYSAFDGQFRSMVLGPESISWGIQFSYPQVMQNPETQEMERVSDSDAFPNTALFRALQRWIRHHTRPTPFIVNGQCVHVPMRLGYTCLKWIGRHPQLQSNALTVGYTEKS